MEIRMRSAVSRIAKGYSVEATLDIGITTAVPGGSSIPTASEKTAIDALGEYQIAKLKEHMKALGEAFPREE